MFSITGFERDLLYKCSKKDNTISNDQRNFKNGRYINSWISHQNLLQKKNLLTVLLKQNNQVYPDYIEVSPQQWCARCPATFSSLEATREQENCFESNSTTKISKSIFTPNILKHFFSFIPFRPDQKKDDIGLIRTMASGAVGGITLWTVIFPADVIKSRIQIGNMKATMLEVGAKIIKEEGILALYNGLKPTIVRTIPATAVLFVVYEYSKKAMTELFI